MTQIEFSHGIVSPGAVAALLGVAPGVEYGYNAGMGNYRRGAIAAVTVLGILAVLLLSISQPRSNAKIVEDVREPLKRQQPGERVFARLILGGPRTIIAPRGSATAGSQWISCPLWLSISEKRGVWIDGYSVNKPFYAICTRASDSENWTEFDTGFCGTGAEMQCVSQGVTPRFSVAVPARYSGQEIRVAVVVFDNESGANPVAVVSDAAQIPNAAGISLHR